MNDIATKPKPRIQYLDTTKGILMLCLLYGHMRIISNGMGINDFVLRGVNTTVGFYVCFFMQTFFIITGFCSSFNIPFREYLWKNVKTLLIPAFILTIISFCVESAMSSGPWWNSFTGLLSTLPSWLTDGGPWFIISLFWAKILFWFILKIDMKWQICVLAMLYIFALWLDSLQPFPNYQWHRHTFLLMPYLALGYCLKIHRDAVEAHLGKWAVIGAALIFVENILYHTPYFALPWHDANININYYNFPLHIITAVAGSATVVYVARRLSKLRVLSDLGGGSLLIYLLNSAVHTPIIYLLKPLHNPESIIGCTLFHLTSYLLCIGVMYVLVKLIYGRRWLSWMVGKW